MVATRVYPPSEFNLMTWRKAVASVRQGDANATVLCIGDSTTAGYGAGGTGWSGAKARATPKVLADILTAAGIRAGVASFIGSQNVGDANLATYDPRLSFGAGWSEFAAQLALGGRLLQNSTTTNPIAFTPAGQFDKIDVWYNTYPGLGSFTVNVDGSATLATIDQNGGADLKKTTLTTTLGTHTVNLARASGLAFIFGVVAYNSAEKEVSILNAGSSGSTSSDLVAAGDPYQYFPAISKIAPALSIINIGVNDWDIGAPVDTYSSNVQSLVTQCKLSGDVVLVVPPPSATAAASADTQSQFRAALKSLGAANNVPVVDLSSRWTSQASALAHGFYVDDLHPAGVGYADIASAISSVLKDP